MYCIFKHFCSWHNFALSLICSFSWFRSPWMPLHNGRVCQLNHHYENSSIIWLGTFHCLDCMYLRPSNISYRRSEVWYLSINTSVHMQMYSFPIVMGNYSPRQLYLIPGCMSIYLAIQLSIHITLKLCKYHRYAYHISRDAYTEIFIILYDIFIYFQIIFHCLKTDIKLYERWFCFSLLEKILYSAI